MEHSLEDINVLYNYMYMDLDIKGRKYKMWLIFHLGLIDKSGLFWLEAS